MTTTTSYISCACNRLPHTLDWGRNGLVCYAANHSVVIYDPDVNKFGSVLTTLHGHNNRVSTVRWIKPEISQLEYELISASSDGTAIIWSVTDLKARLIKKKFTLNVGDPLSICDAIYLSPHSSELLICTGSINGDFRLWLRDNRDDIKEIQAIGTSKKLAIHARLTNLSKSTILPLLLVAMEDSTIHIYVPDYEATEYCKLGKFVQVQTLIGHEDWVTCIDCTMSDEEDIFVASGSQDNMIRLWKISKSVNNDNDIKDGILRAKKQKFSICSQDYEIILESILSSHEAWVYGVHWSPAIQMDGKIVQPMKLISCSLDKSAIIWEPSGNVGIWCEAVRVGEVGGNSLGFYGCKLGPTGKSIIAHGFQGAFYIWEYREKENDWIPRTAPSGHFDQVVDLCWDPKGRFLMTASLDQTTRVHAPWTLSNNQESWHEIARPQVHGYDMSCLAMLTPFMFASGAEEKVVRIFTAPLPFKNYLQKITDDVEDFESATMIGASVPALGLTNKALQENESDGKREDDLLGSYSRNLNYDEPPLEEELIRGTLWPELQKLYGHGYEIFSMAARHDGSLFATASKSASVEHASIILWDTQTWSQCQKLIAHQLTVTQLAFSPNDKYLLSVSRDRRWSLFILKNGKYELTAASMKKDTVHARIIWCCAWSSDSKYFVTGSRDGKIGFWSENVGVDGKLLPLARLNVDLSVTALAFAPNELQDFPYIVAIGFENGCIEIRKISQIKGSESYEWTQLVVLDSSRAHHATVKRLAFRPQYKSLQLASCGSDGIVKVHSITLS